MNSDRIIDYMNENLRGYTFGQLRYAALDRLSYPGADFLAEDRPEIQMPEDVALYLVNNVLHNLPHNDRLKAKDDAAEGEKKDLIDKHYRMIVDGAEDDIRDLRKQGYAEADIRKLAEQYAEEEMGREADRSGAYSDLDSAIAEVSDRCGYFRLSIFERLSFFERYEVLRFGESASGEPYVVLDVSREEILERCLELSQVRAVKEEPGCEFTEDEIEVVSDYLLRKMVRLEESGLADSYCYPRIASFRAKLLKKDRKKSKKSIYIQ